MPYPLRQPIQNGYQVVGQALTQASGQLNDFEDRQAKARALMEEMVANRQKRALEELQAQREAERQAQQLEIQKAEEQRKADEAARAAAFRDKVAGQVISKTLNADPSLSRSSKPVVPGGPTQSELDDLGNVQGIALPNQDVSGTDSTQMMGNALDRMAGQGDMANGRTPLTPEEILRAGLETGQMGQARDYASAVKDLREKPEDPFNSPTLLADYKIKSQDPGFRKLAEGYAKDPMRYGPALQAWANQNGYSGQKWWNTELDNMFHQSPYSMANKNVVSDDEKNFWAEQYAAGKVDPTYLAGMFSSRGGNKAEILGDITRRAQALNPDVDIAGDIRGAKSAGDQTNRRTVATIDNVTNRMGRILELSNSIDRTRFPTLNKFLLSTERGAGAMKAQMLRLNEALTGEELSQVFGQGSAGSDAKLKLAQEISSLGELPIDVAQAKIQEIEGALENRRHTFTGIMGRYGMPKPSTSGQTPANPPASVEWVRDPQTGKLRPK